VQIATTFRHMETSNAVREYAIERLSKLLKYFRRDPIAAHAVFSVENEHQYAVELSLTLPNGLVLQAHESTEDMYSSIDLASARIERQVRRWKDKIRDHKPHKGPSFSVSDNVLHGESLEPRPGKAAAKGAKGTTTGKVEKGGKKEPAKASKLVSPAAPKLDVIREQTFTVRTLRVDDAVMQLNLLENNFLVFTNAETGTITVTYRRQDGHYGLLDTGAKVSANSADT
jgi:putative sigma-54 modulation protein